MADQSQNSKILVLNGPNLNMLGVREPDIYGHTTLGDIEQACLEHAEDVRLTVDFRQSNSEGELITWVQDARETHDGIIINAGGLSHTSIALMDALKAYGRAVVEVHLSNVFQRDSFRHHSYMSLAADGVIVGFGARGYLLALDALAMIIADYDDDS